MSASYIIAVIIIVILIFLIYYQGKFMIQTESNENFQARYRPISGIGVSTDIYQRKDGMIREISSAFAANGGIITQDMITGCNPQTNIWDGSGGWGISPAMSGTVYRENTDNRKVPFDKLYKTLHGL